MARYIFKPLLTYLEGDSAEIREKFLNKYKESLMTGELMVDLTQYDIYISNAGFEFPIPITKDIREEIINWIESDEGPMAKLKSSKLINESTSGSEISLIRKYELIDKLLKEINIYRILMFIKSDDTENQLRMIERECNVFYRDLSSYAITFVNTSTGGSKDIINIYNEVKVREQMLWKRYMDLKIKTNTLISDVYTFKKFNYEKKYNKDEKNVKEVLIDNLKTIINNSVKLNAKLNTYDFEEKNLLNGEITFKIKSNNGDFENEILEKIQKFDYLSMEYMRSTIYDEVNPMNGKNGRTDLDKNSDILEDENQNQKIMTSEHFPFYPANRDYKRIDNKYAPKGPFCKVTAKYDKIDNTNEEDHSAILVTFNITTAGEED